MNESLMFARYIAGADYDDIPASIVAVCKNNFLDGLGVMLAATSLGEGCQYFTNVALAEGSNGKSTILGNGAKVTASMAAFANGSLSHALDYEDLGPGGHPNASSIPAIMAVAESIGKVSGKEFITALAVGSDVYCRLGLAQGEGEDIHLMESGWYPPSIRGSFGATASVCKLLGLTQEQVLDALSLTLCQATCSFEFNFSSRSVVRAVRDAFSAKAAVISSLLAREGVAGFDQPIEGKAGFFTMYARGNYDRHKLTDSLGKVFEGGNATFKAWPACGGTHPFIQAALQIADEYDIKPADIKEIKFVLQTPSTMLCEPLEIKQKPTAAIGAKFSIPFCIATALVHKKVTLDHFTPKALLNTDVLQVAKKISYEIATKPDRNFAAPPGLVQVKTKNEEISSKGVKFLYGHPKNPMSQEAIIDKFMNCAAYSAREISKNNLDRILYLISHLEDVKNISEIVKCL
jgi:2-methylcitrate dehydratase PrpD